MGSRKELEPVQAYGCCEKVNSKIVFLFLFGNMLMFVCTFK